MRLVTVSAREAAFLAQEVKNKYESLSGEVLVITSYLARYEELMNTIKAKTACFKGIDIVSTGLLRKLLESGKREEPTKINRQFVDACYLFISDCQYTRSAYNEKFGTPAIRESEQPPGSRTFHWPFKGQRVHFSVRKDIFIPVMFVFLAFLGWTLISNWQYILLQIPSPAPRYLWWVAEYPDGTKVFNHFRRYRTEKEVIEYFHGHGLNDGSRVGDCNAVYWSDDNRVNVCYDTTDTIRKFEEEHGGQPEIRFDG